MTRMFSGIGLIAQLLCCIALLCTSVRGQNSKGAEGCVNREFACTDGVSINSSAVCDGVLDCSDGLDERFCQNQLECKLDQISCTSSQKQCVSLTVICDGVEDCSSGFDEMKCPEVHPESACSSNQFPCSESGPCIALANRCDGVGDCPNGDDETHCGVPKLIEVSEDISVKTGENFTLTCEADGYPSPFVTWIKNLQPIPVNSRYSLSSENGLGTLHIQDARVIDGGDYNCLIVSNLHGTIVVQPSVRVEIVNDLPFFCEDHVNQKFTEGSFFYTLKPFAIGPASSAAADIIFVVDESGSMAMEHEWIRREVVLLNVGLKQQGVGVGERENMFALVGFGRNDPVDITGVTLTSLAPLDEFISASFNLELTGVLEDGYAAIDHALITVQTRNGTAKQIILVTDEDRGVLRSDLSRDAIRQRLIDAGIVLNVVVNQGFLASADDPTTFALGLNGNGTAYVVDTETSSLFTTVDGGAPSSEQFFTFGNTLEDYVELAFSVGGLAWDLNQLREQGIFAKAFTNAFTQAKVNEVMTVFRVCFSCQCSAPEETCNIQHDVCKENCVGPVQMLNVLISPSVNLAPLESSVTFKCIVYSSETNLSLLYSWDYPSQANTNILIDGEILTVESVGQESEGMYRCSVMENNTGISLFAESTLSIDTRCLLQDGGLLTLGDFKFMLLAPADNGTRAVDVVLLVDESGSMTMEHAWIPSMTKRLDESLMKLSIGVNPRNYFGIVGFGDDCSEDSAFGRIVFGSLNRTFTTAENITDFTQELKTGGRTEDGYSAIREALDGYEFRNVAKQFILITDEDRDELVKNLTQQAIKTMLMDNEALLNVAISEEFSANKLRALGIDSGDNAFVYDPTLNSLFRIIKDSGKPVEDSAHGTTSEDYTQVALQLGGAAWDLSLLRQGNSVAEAFTNAFVHAKVAEIQAQIEECYNCTCTSSGLVCTLLPGASNLSFCTRQPATPRPTESPIDVSIDTSSLVIMPGETHTLTCTVNTSAVLGWTFNGGLLPENVVVRGRRRPQSYLEIFGATEQNTGLYACFAHSPSEAFNGVTFAQVMYFDPDRELILELQPLEQSVLIGRNQTILCRVVDSTNVTWSFSGGDLPLNVIITNSASQSLLTVIGAMDTNSGGYTCTATSSLSGFARGDTSYVDVVVPQLQLAIEPGTVEVDAGSSIELLCRVICDCPDVVLRWSKPGEELPLQAEITITEREMEVTALLSIANVSEEDAGRYSCSANFLGASVTREVYVFLTTTITALKVNIDGPSRAIIELGVNHSLLCEANQNVSEYLWHFNDTPVRVQEQLQKGAIEDIVPNNVLVVNVFERRSLLAILDARVDNSGIYECFAIFGNERVSTSVEIKVGKYS